MLMASICKSQRLPAEDAFHEAQQLPLVLESPVQDLASRGLGV